MGRWKLENGASERRASTESTSRKFLYIIKRSTLFSTGRAKMAAQDPANAPIESARRSQKERTFD